MSIETQIAEAEAALHDLATGRAVRVVVDQNGERVEYAPSTMTRLRAYLADLKAQAAGSTSVSGPMRIII